MKHSPHDLQRKDTQIRLHSSRSVDAFAVASVMLDATGACVAVHTNAHAHLDVL